MNRPSLVNARERLKPTPELPYGPDPGDASVEHAYLKVQEEIRLGIIDLRSYPNEGSREKERFQAEAIAPKSRVLRALLTIVLAMFETEMEQTRR